MFSKIDRSGLHFNQLLIIIFMLGLELSKLVPSSGLHYLMFFAFAGAISYTCFKIFKYCEGASMGGLVIFGVPLLMLVWVNVCILDFIFGLNYSLLSGDYVVCYFIALFAYMVTSFNKAFAESQD